MQLIKIKQHSSHKPHDVHLKKISSLALVCFLLLQLSSTLVDGQLEAVGAVLSVVPVTSILATAGLVGVKLAALSRLLQVLGYDQAYLASADGTGTAAQPIGLQSHYSYMFPYGPGVNISVKEDHDRYQGSRLTPAKTYPAMGLPGDYELEHNPFRGSEMLKDIFRNAGLNAPIHQQQYQVKGYQRPQAAYFVSIPESTRTTRSLPRFEDGEQQSAAANPAPAHHGAFVPARSSLVQKLPAAEPPMSPGDRSSAQELPKQPETRADNGAFGMPAMNIQQLRRRRSVRRKIMSSVHDLPPLGKANSNR